MNNSRYKSIQSQEQLEKFLTEHRSYFVIDRRDDRENRFRVVSEKDQFGLSVDGRSVRMLVATGKVNVRRIYKERS